MPERLTELISADRLAARVSELADQISSDYKGCNLLVIGVLKGSFIFLADLVRKIRCDQTIDFLRVASYGASTETSGVVEIRKDLEIPVAGRDILVVEDIVDTGLTLDFLLRHLRLGGPKSLKLCAMLDKPSRRMIDLKVDYVGFAIDDLFVVGYGLDCSEKYRYLPAIHVYEPGC